MSMARLLVAARDQLRTGVLVLNETNTTIQSDGQPPPISGQFHVALHGLDWGVGGPLGTGLDEVYSLGITVTMRAPVIPKDSQAEEIYVKKATGLEDLVRKVIVEMEKERYTIINAANTNMPDSLDGFVEPLRWEGADAEPRLVGPDWFLAVPDPNQPDSGMVMETRFGQARRIQALANFT